jgi:hypothetical protein
MDDVAFVKWCQEELQIGIGVIVNASNILKKIDTALIKQHLAAARDIAQQQKILAQINKAKEKEQRIAANKEAARRKRKRANDRRYRKRKRAETKTFRLAAE